MQHFLQLLSSILQTVEVIFKKHALEQRFSIGGARCGGQKMAPHVNIFSPLDGDHE